MSAEPDAFLGGRLRLRQPPRGAHRAGTDAVLLARLVVPAPGDTLYDLGASTGAVGLAAARMSEACRVVLVERDPDLAALALENASANGLAERVAVIAADVLAPGAQRRAAGLEAGCADIVLTNPPFFEAGGHRPPRPAEGLGACLRGRRTRPLAQNLRRPAAPRRTARPDPPGRRPARLPRRPARTLRRLRRPSRPRPERPAGDPRADRGREGQPRALSVAAAVGASGRGRALHPGGRGAALGCPGRRRER